MISLISALLLSTFFRFSYLPCKHLCVGHRVRLSLSSLSLSLSRKRRNLVLSHHQLFLLDPLIPQRRSSVRSFHSSTIHSNGSPSPENGDLEHTTPGNRTKTPIFTLFALQLLYAKMQVKCQVIFLHLAPWLSFTFPLLALDCSLCCPSVSSGAWVRGGKFNSLAGERWGMTWSERRRIAGEEGTRSHPPLSSPPVPQQSRLSGVGEFLWGFSCSVSLSSLRTITLVTKSGRRIGTSKWQAAEAVWRLYRRVLVVLLPWFATRDAPLSLRVAALSQSHFIL